MRGRDTYTPSDMWERIVQGVGRLSHKVSLLLFCLACLQMAHKGGNNNNHNNNKSNEKRTMRRQKR